MNVYEKQKITNLIRYGAEGDMESFKSEALLIAAYLYKNGDEDLALYIHGLFQEANVLIPQ